MPKFRLLDPEELNAVVNYLTSGDFAKQLRWLVRNTLKTRIEHQVESQISKEKEIKGIIDYARGASSDKPFFDQVIRKVGVSVGTRNEVEEHIRSGSPTAAGDYVPGGSEGEIIPHAHDVYFNIHTHPVPKTVDPSVARILPSEGDLEASIQEYEERPFFLAIIAPHERETHALFYTPHNFLMDRNIKKWYDNREMRMSSTSPEGLVNYLQEQGILAHHVRIDTRALLKADYTLPRETAHAIAANLFTNRAARTGRE